MICLDVDCEELAVPTTLMCPDHLPTGGAHALATEYAVERVLQARESFDELLSPARLEASHDWLAARNHGVRWLTPHLLSSDAEERDFPRHIRRLADVLEILS